MASFLLGAPADGQIDFNVFPIYMWKYLAPWVQDDWRITRKLTLNLGLRWDLSTPVRERFDHMNYAFDPGALNPVSALIDKTRFPGFEVRGGLRFAGVDGNPREPWKFDGSNIQPRLGAVYELDDWTVLRGGYGRYYMNPVSVGFTQGFSIQTPFVASLDGSRTPLYNLGNPFPAASASRPARPSASGPSWAGASATRTPTSRSPPSTSSPSASSAGSPGTWSWR
jgi:outer membrane receptor protein involved in Fe transport